MPFGISNFTNPNNTGRIIRRAFKNIRIAATNVSKETVQLFNEIPYRRVDAETGQVINNNIPGFHPLYNNEVRYEYLLDATTLEGLSARIDQILWENYMETTGTRPPFDWYMYSAVDDGSFTGVTQAVASLSAQVDNYPNTVQSITSSPAYIERVAFVRARVFENMKGLTEDTRADLTDTLARGMDAGLNPRTIAKDIKQRVGVSKSSANRIAQTEINTAHRRSVWAEDQDANQRLNIPTKLLHASALKPTTRTTHAIRHGNLYTRQEVNEWYTKDANAINCYCSQTSVVLDEDGKPVQQGLVKKMKERGKKFFGVK